MKALTIKGIITGLLLSFSLFSYAQEALWEQLNSQAVTLYQEGRSAEAIKVTLEVLKVAKETFGPEDPKVATALNNLGVFYFSLGKYTEAETYHKQALRLREKTLGPDHPFVAQSMNNLGELYRIQKIILKPNPSSNVHWRSEKNLMSPIIPISANPSITWLNFIRRKEILPWLNLFFTRLKDRGSGYGTKPLQVGKLLQQSCRNIFLSGEIY